MQPLLPESARLLPEPVRRVAAWCVVALLVTGVVVVAVRLCVEFKTAVVPVLLALLGTALLGPLYRRLVRAKVNRSIAAACHLRRGARRRRRGHVHRGGRADRHR